VRDAAQRRGQTQPPFQNVEPRDLRIDFPGQDVAVVTFHLGSSGRGVATHVHPGQDRHGMEDHTLACLQYCGRPRCPALTSVAFGCDPRMIARGRAARKGTLLNRR
jgi:hypothetical protein